jgi:paraquat-inducible protein B
MSDAPSSKPRRTEAEIRRSRWPGWIWAVPIAAVAIVIWLVARSWEAGGKDITVVFDHAAGMSGQTEVTNRGVKVGKVKSVKLDKDERHVTATIHIDDDATDDLKSDTRFYLEGAEPTLSDLSSLKAVISGPTIVMVPGGGAHADHFAGRTGKPPEILAEPVRYLVRFKGDVGDLSAGAPVTLRGFTVGEIVSTGFSADPQTGAIAAPVVLALDAQRFHIAKAAGGGDAAARMTALLTKLVEKGLRAKLAQSPPLIGRRQVTLEVVSDASPATLAIDGQYPEIPSDEGGSLDALMTRLGQFPIAEIGNDTRSIAEHVNDLVASPQLKDSVDHLEHALAELDSVTRRIGPQLTPTIDDLRKAASEIDATAATARKTLGGSAAAEGNLQESLHELSNAARAVRSLADYLDRHPEALIQGR